MSAYEESAHAGLRRILSVSVTEAGRRLAVRLPYEHTHGNASATLQERWADIDAVVLMVAVGAAVRMIAPLLNDKRTDPAVVSVDEAGKYAVALTGGHRGAATARARGANSLARTVARLLGAQPVITTASDATGTTALDSLPGMVASGDVARVSAALLDGRDPLIDNALDWPLPRDLRSGAGPERIVVTDHEVAAPAGTMVLHPPSLVAGVGASSSAPGEELGRLLADALASQGLAAESLSEVATIDRRRYDRAITGFGLPVRSFSSEELARVDVPTPSRLVESAVGTPSVAEAAALAAAGDGGTLLVGKRRSAHATVALARRARPRGSLCLVGLGPGSAENRTPAAEAAVRRAELVVGYERYVEQCADLLGPGQEVACWPLGEELDRANHAVSEALRGRSVAVVCSGDSGVYAMASPCMELLERATANRFRGTPPDIDIRVVPGVPAGVAAAAALGAPLGHDHATISLSDLLTPWPVIEGRLRAAAESDMVVVLYNPRSSRRTWQLGAALKILAEQRGPSTVAGVVTDATRPGQRVEVTTLADLRSDSVGMTSCVIVGASGTRAFGGRMVTPRGYRT